MAKNDGFDLGDLGDIVGGLIQGKGVDVKTLEPLWEKVQPTLKGLDTDAILDTVGNWAKGLDLPLVNKIPDGTIDDLKNGVKVPLSKLIKG
ncbi:hypothetical protein EYE40_02610 [Glaciihabitans arcticus]|uniref:Uncharacterized protein n=1 Tax=Glaciihabitans arcticus TaxID=2668039 RepID=A0A4Q9GTC7_9MICO|nr:hypothetical protein [Glaciihabitans arcticus]TBN56377.1 hypothetical protein EYE40_02610 [Glaciihabitans arcticus]